MNRLKKIKGIIKVNEQIQDLIKFYQFLNYTKTQDGDQSIMSYTGFYFLIEEIIDSLDLSLDNYIVNENNMATVFTRVHKKYNVQNLKGQNFNANMLGAKNYFKINNKLKQSGYKIELITNEYGACSILTKI